MIEDPGKTRATYAAIIFLLVIYCGGYLFVRFNDWLVIARLTNIEYDTGYSHIIVPGEEITLETGKLLQIVFYPLVYIEGHVQDKMRDPNERV